MRLQCRSGAASSLGIFRKVGAGCSGLDAVHSDSRAIPHALRSHSRVARSRSASTVSPSSRTHRCALHTIAMTGALGCPAWAAPDRKITRPSEFNCMASSASIRPASTADIPAWFSRSSASIRAANSSTSTNRASALIAATSSAPWLGASSPAATDASTALHCSVSVPSGNRQHR